MDGFVWLHKKIADDCLYSVNLKYADNTLKCDCENPCREMYYSPRVSHSRWPAKKYQVKTSRIHFKFNYFYYISSFLSGDLPCGTRTADPDAPQLERSRQNQRQPRENRSLLRNVRLRSNSRGWIVQGRTWSSTSTVCFKLLVNILIYGIHFQDVVFISDLGGTFGLWVGWSFITFFEFLEFFLDLIVQRCRKKQLQKRADEKKAPTDNFNDCKISDVKKD